MKSPENMKKWGFPDGRDRSSYPDHEDSWSDDRWRWEFTRRREDYCKDFEWAAAETVKSKRAIVATMDEDDRQLYGPMHFDPEHPGFTTTVDLERFSKKYGFGYLVHPKYDFEQSPSCFCNSPPPVGLWVGSGKRFVPLDADLTPPPTTGTVPLPEGLLAIVVDPSKKLEPQFKEYYAQALAAQKTMFGAICGRRKHRGTWIRYLRVIDARAAGATLKRLADIAASAEGDNSVQNALQVWDAARHLMFNWPT